MFDGLAVHNLLKSVLTIADFEVWIHLYHLPDAESRGCMACTRLVYILPLFASGERFQPGLYCFKKLTLSNSAGFQIDFLVH